MPDGSQVAELDLENLDSFDCAVFKGFDVLIHTAAYAHTEKVEGSGSLQKYRKVNCDATLQLARLAINAGIKRFVFLSSIGVNGANSFRPFVEEDKVGPHDNYSLSKYEAEFGLLNIAKNVEMEVVIIRPPLVYGPGASGSFRVLMCWVGRSVPMPFGVIHNHRSFVALDNLVDFILLCANKDKSPKAANEVFLISDGEDVSTSVFLRKASVACNVKSRLFPVPVLLMDFVARLFGRSDISNRLFGNLQIDSSKAQTLLNWRPVITMDEQLKKSCKF
ncbi:NAD-dependent epimerase/dehydratase family protein [Candidatus Thioglobus sp.]|nr:NAD-dependent epimerase/dehydratase family protein [Candidatus Thioglobus sp.]